MANLHPLIPHIMQSYTNKMVNVSWPWVPWRHFTLYLERFWTRSWQIYCGAAFTSTWPTTAVSCPTALGALCAQLMFRLAWCRLHSAVMVTELLQPRDLASGTLFQSSCVILSSPTDCSDDSWRDNFFGKHKHGALWLLICGAIEKHLLTYLLTYHGVCAPGLCYRNYAISYTHQCTTAQWRRWLQEQHEHCNQNYN